MALCYMNNDILLKIYPYKKRLYVFRFSAFQTDAKKNTNEIKIESLNKNRMEA